MNEIRTSDVGIYPQIPERIAALTVLYELPYEARFDLVRTPGQRQRAWVICWSWSWTKMRGWRLTPFRTKFVARLLVRSLRFTRTLRQEKLLNISTHPKTQISEFFLLEVLP